MQIGKIQIRRAEPDDFAAIHAIYSCPTVIAGTLQLPYPSLEQWKKRLAEPSSDRYVLVAVVQDQVVGNLGLQVLSNPRRLHVGTIGMGIHDEWQGNGIGTVLMQACINLADNWLNLERLELEVYTDNEAAIHLYDRFGFEQEGRRRHFAFRDGGYVDVFAMARLRSLVRSPDC